MPDILQQAVLYRNIFRTDKSRVEKHNGTVYYSKWE